MSSWSPRPSTVLTVTITLVVLTVALTVGWQILVARESDALIEGFSAVHWTLVAVGSLFFALIITAAILMAIWLVREIRLTQRQQNFLDAVTHELHTPLASLRLYVDTFRNQNLDPSRRNEFLEMMIDDIERLQHTIDQILHAARNESRRRESVDLVPLLNDCVDTAIETHDLPSAAFVRKLPQRAAVKGDAEQLRVAFRNLIENAVRYAGQEISVEVAVAPSTSRRIEVRVSDQGVGLSASALTRVFQRFQRISHEGVSASGLGLGLYIVRNVVRAHGGSIRAESAGAGAGSSFVVTLPGQLDGYTHPAG